jgi:hypothetical protein
MNALILGGHGHAVDLRVRSFREDPTLAFQGTRRAHTVNEIIVHETVTRDVATTLRVLRRRKLGVHFLVAPDGEALQLADPLTTRLEHAAPHNARSIGIEIVNPYEPRLLRRGLPWSRTIRARWAHGGSYVLPTAAQAEACTQLLAGLCDVDAPRLEVPRLWRGLNGDVLAMGRVAGARRPAAGIYAHTYFHHADGAWPVLYAALRLRQGLSPREAFEQAVVLASGDVRRVRLPRHPMNQGGAPWSQT